MSLHDRVMTPPRAYSSAALRVAVSGRQPAARGLDRRPACRCATRQDAVAGTIARRGPDWRRGQSRFVTQPAGLAELADAGRRPVLGAASIASPQADWQT